MEPFFSTTLALINFFRSRQMVSSETMGMSSLASGMRMPPNCCMYSTSLIWRSDRWTCLLPSFCLNLRSRERDLIFSLTRFSSILRARVKYSIQSVRSLLKRSEAFS